MCSLALCLKANMKSLTFSQLTNCLFFSRLMALKRMGIVDNYEVSYMCMLIVFACGFVDHGTKVISWLNFLNSACFFFLMCRISVILLWWLWVSAELGVWQQRCWQDVELARWKNILLLINIAFDEGEHIPTCIMLFFEVSYTGISRCHSSSHFGHHVGTSIYVYIWNTSPQYLIYLCICYRLNLISSHFLFNLGQTEIHVSSHE